jgi:iron(III) transport system substrate-binding protein
MKVRTVAGVFAGVGLAAVSATSTLAGATTEPPTSASDGAELDAAYEALVAAATEDGSVTVYSGQAQDNLNELADLFQETYPGIDVEIVRMADGDTIPRVDTEIATGTAGGDLVITSGLQWNEGHAAAGEFVDPTISPQVAGLGAYDAETYVHEGLFFEVGAAILTFAWNTELVPDGITDFPDLLDPSLADGKVAVIDPSISPVLIDYYDWLTDSFGDDFVELLAGQAPRIYPSALPIGEALASGEVAAAAYAAPIQLAPAADNGAPVAFGISEAGAWGGRFYGAIPVSADDPSAAALFADFMLTPAGQEIMGRNGSTVLPDVPGALITNADLRPLDPALLTPEASEEFLAEWDDLFR